MIKEETSDINIGNKTAIYKQDQTGEYINIYIYNLSQHPPYTILVGGRFSMDLPTTQCLVAGTLRSGSKHHGFHAWVGQGRRLTILDELEQSALNRQ